MTDRRILATGAAGQIGSEPVPAARERSANDRVVASDVRLPTAGAPGAHCPFERVYCTHIREIHRVVRHNDAGTIFRLAQFATGGNRGPYQAGGHSFDVGRVVLMGHVSDGGGSYDPPLQGAITTQRLAGAPPSESAYLNRRLIGREPVSGG